LESSNKQLRSDNARLEGLIRQAKQRHQLLLQQVEAAAAAAAAQTITPSNSTISSMISIPKPRGSTLAQLMTSDSSSNPSQNRLSIQDIMSLRQNNTYTNDLSSLQTLFPYQRLHDNEPRSVASMNDIYQSYLFRERERANTALSATYASHNDLSMLSTQRQSIHELTKLLSTKPNVPSHQSYCNHQSDYGISNNISQVLALRNIIDNQNRRAMPMIGIPTTTTESSLLPSSSSLSLSLLSMQRDRGMNHNSHCNGTLLSNIASNVVPTATTNTMYPTSVSAQQEDPGNTNLTLLQMFLRQKSQQR
jgi:hypothetical protein